MQGHTSPRRLPPLPEDGETAEVEILLAEPESDDVSLASAHTPVEEGGGVRAGGGRASGGPRIFSKWGQKFRVGAFAT